MKDDLILQILKSHDDLFSLMDKAKSTGLNLL